MIEAFPAVEDAHSTGLLAVGGDLEVESLLLAYRSGIFPWPPDSETLAWFAPPKRAIIYLSDFHIPKSLRRVLNRNQFDLKRDNSFREVIAACANSTHRGEGHGTWITPDIINAYTELYESGYARSFEAYENGVLVGGVYGVHINRFFAAESMFYTRSNAGKCALVYGIEWLKTQGVGWVDCQVINSNSKRLGAVEIRRSQYMKLLREALSS